MVLAPWQKCMKQTFINGINRPHIREANNGVGSKPRKMLVLHLSRLDPKKFHVVVMTKRNLWHIKRTGIGVYCTNYLILNDKLQRIDSQKKAGNEEEDTCSGRERGRTSYLKFVSIISSSIASCFPNSLEVKDFNPVTIGILNESYPFHFPCNQIHRFKQL